VLCPAAGRGALSAKSSSYLDDCCLLISSYTAPSMNATSLLLFVDPDSSRAAPAGYVWPYDGSEGEGAAAAAAAAAAGGSSSAGRQGLSSAGLAGLVVGIVAAAVLAALLIWLLAARRRRRKQQQQYVQNGGGIYKLPSAFTVDMNQSSNNSGYSSTAQGMYSSSKQPGQQLGPGQDGRPVADVAVLGSSLLQDQQQQSYQQGYSQNGSGSEAVVGTTGNTGGQSIGGTGSTGDDGAVPGTKRWQKLTTAISSKVQDIHQQRLRTAFMQSQHSGNGSVVLAGAAAKGASHGGGSRSLQQGSGGLQQQQPQAQLSGLGDGSSGQAGLQFAGGSSSSGTLSHSGTAVTAAGVSGGAALGGGSEGQQGDGRNTLALKELIGRGTFGTVYR
jgi:hypothetical protein